MTNETDGSVQEQLVLVALIKRFRGILLKGSTTVDKKRKLIAEANILREASAKGYEKTSAQLHRFIRNVKHRIKTKVDACGRETGNLRELSLSAVEASFYEILNPNGNNPELALTPGAIAAGYPRQDSHSVPEPSQAVEEVASVSLLSQNRPFMRNGVSMVQLRAALRSAHDVQPCGSQVAGLVQGMASSAVARPSSATARPPAAPARPSSAMAGPSSATARPPAAPARPSSAMAGPSAATARPPAAIAAPSRSSVNALSTGPRTATPGIFAAAAANTTSATAGTSLSASGTAPSTIRPPTTTPGIFAAAAANAAASAMARPASAVARGGSGGLQTRGMLQIIEDGFFDNDLDEDGYPLVLGPEDGTDHVYTAPAGDTAATTGLPQRNVDVLPQVGRDERDLFPVELTLDDIYGEEEAELPVSEPRRRNRRSAPLQDQQMEVLEEPIDIAGIQRTLLLSHVQNSDVRNSYEQQMKENAAQMKKNLALENQVLQLKKRVAEKELLAADLDLRMKRARAGEP